jgi:hypothetical protein
MKNIARCDTAVVTAPFLLRRVGPRHGSHRTEAVRVARSVIMPVDDRAAEADDVTAELEAIVAVGKALARLGNPESQRRVLNWAIERFDAPPEATTVASVTVTNMAVPDPLLSDPTLQVDGLEDLFDGARGPALRAADGVDDRLDDIFDVPAAASHHHTPPVGRDESRGEVLVHDFISGLRRLVSGFRFPATLGVIGRT